MKKEDWISAKQTLPEDSKDKKYLIHLPGNEKTDNVKICSYDHKTHTFSDGSSHMPYTVDDIDFWTEIKEPSTEQESMYRFHEGMVIKDWNNVIYLVKKVKERSYETVIFGDNTPFHDIIPIALQGKYTIIREDDITELKPMFKVGMKIRDTSDRKVYTVENIRCDASVKCYEVVDDEGTKKKIFLGRQLRFKIHYNFEDGDIVRKLKKYSDSSTLYRLHKNNKEEPIGVPHAQVITSFYQPITKLDFSLTPVEEYTSSFADIQISVSELEDCYEIVEKHDEPFDIKKYIKK